jgi:hypothetical protein
MASVSDIAVRRPERGFWPLSPGTVYLAVSVALLGPWIAQYLIEPIGFHSPGRDSWHHVAVLRELMAAPFAPSNPHIPTDEPSRYFTPIAVLAALFGKLFGLSPYQLFGAIGAATCAGLVAGCWTFGRRYYRSAWAPLALLLVLLFAWGWQFSHTGLHNYKTMAMSAGYPASIALVLGLLSWGYALRVVQSGRAGPGACAILGVASAVILLTHQLSGVVVLAGLGSLILFDRGASLRLKVVLLGAIAVGCLATLAWPYFRVIDVVTSASDPRWRSAWEPINHGLTLLVMMAPTFLGVFGFRKPAGGWRWELLLPCAVFALAYVLLAARGSVIAHRFPPAIILYNQLGLVWLFFSGAPVAARWPAAKRKIVAVACAAIAIAGLVSIVRDLDETRRQASAESMVDMAEAIGAHMGAGSVAFATEGIVFPVQASGRRVVSIPRPEPAAPSLGLRQQATDRFFAPATTLAERRRLGARWGATHVALYSGDLSPEVIRDLRRLGPSTGFGGGVEVITIAPPTTPVRRTP